MPAGTRELVAALKMRQPYKVLLEISARAGRIFSQLDALFWDQAKRRRVEIAHCRDARRSRLDIAVAPHDVLIDVPKPEKWEMDVQVHFDHPASWHDAADDAGPRPRASARVT